MGTQILYEKKYAKVDVTALAAEDTSCETAPAVSADVLFRELVDNYEYVLEPERLLFKNIFIKKVIAFSEVYEIDLQVIERTGGVTATLSFEEAAFLTNLKDVFPLSDEILVSSASHEHTITVSLTYYTHRIQKKNGEIVREI